MMLNGKNKSFDEQLKVLESILMKSNNIKYLLKILDELGIEDCYVAAGCVNQTIFNYYHGYELDYGISDYDIVYYDKDLSYDAEDKIIRLINSKVNDKNIKLDIKNEARVHLWFYEKYGIKREAYNSVYDAISRWTSTVTCIGIRLNNGKFEVYAPYGLDDLFNMVIRPVKIDITKKFYEDRCKKWKENWNNIKIISWEEDKDESIDNRS